MIYCVATSIPSVICSELSAKLNKVSLFKTRREMFVFAFAVNKNGDSFMSEYAPMNEPAASKSS
jgi:hypothetical protein